MLLLLPATLIVAAFVSGCQGKDPLDTAAPPPKPGAVAERGVVKANMPSNSAAGGSGAATGGQQALH